MYVVSKVLNKGARTSCVLMPVGFIRTVEGAMEFNKNNVEVTNPSGYVCGQFTDSDLPPGSSYEITDYGYMEDDNYTEESVKTFRTLENQGSETIDLGEWKLEPGQAMLAAYSREVFSAKPMAFTAAVRNKGLTARDYRGGIVPQEGCINYFYKMQSFVKSYPVRSVDEAVAWNSFVGNEIIKNIRMEAYEADDIGNSMGVAQKGASLIGLLQIGMLDEVMFLLSSPYLFPRDPHFYTEERCRRVIQDIAISRTNPHAFK